MDDTAQNLVQNNQKMNSNSGDAGAVSASVLPINSDRNNDDLLATQLSASQISNTPTGMPNTFNQVVDPVWQSGSPDLSQNPQVQPHPQFGESVQPVGSMAKEAEPVAFGAAETAPVVELREMEVPKEVSEYVKEEKKADLELLEKIEHQGKPMVVPTVQDDLPEVVLPMTKESFDRGMSMGVVSSAKWLAEWCFRVVKKFHGRVVYSQNRE